jgi:hypothetical protein
MVVTNRLLILPLLGPAMLLAAFEGATGQQKSPRRHSIQDSVQQNLAKDLEDDEDGARQLFLLGDEAVSAALALGMMERSDSLPLLRKVAKDDNIGVEEIGKAIRWIENKSIRQTTARTSSNEEELVKSIALDGTFFAEEERKETSVTEVTFNRERNRVLVSLEIYRGPKSARGYDLVLSKRNGDWKVVGIWFAWVA